MLATNPVDNHHAAQFGALNDIGAHSHYPKPGTRSPISGTRLAAVAGLLALGFMAGGMAAGGFAANGSVIQAPTPIGGPVPGEFRLAPGNDVPPGVVRFDAGRAPGDFRLTPGNAAPVGPADR
jgi:hypothetical protein